MGPGAQEWTRGNRGGGAKVRNGDGSGTKLASGLCDSERLVKTDGRIDRRQLGGTPRCENTVGIARGKSG
jgi:hypothetical protein